MQKDDQYQKALDFLYAHIDLSIARHLRYSPERFNLERMRKVMRLLGNPQENYPIIHVAGTKGKGSTCAMIANILTQSGYRTGFYSSPHIVDFRERIRIDNVLISKEKLVAYVGILKNTEDIIPEVSTFELITALAFKYFSDEKVDVGVIEVGMGGRFDATNVVDPVLSVITSISMDHKQILGNRIEDIAFEKAGIIKKGKPVILSEQRPEVVEVIRNIATQKGSELILANQDYMPRSLQRARDGQLFEFQHKNGTKSESFYLPLIGDHQLSNALTVYALVIKLQALGWQIPVSSIEAGFRTVHWPGRLEIVHENPLIIVDGAHNPDSFEKLKIAILQYFKGREIMFIFGASEDKEIQKMLSIIAPVVHQIILTQANHPRAASVATLEKIGKELGIGFISTPQVEEGIETAIQLASPKTVILAAGSLFIAGAVKQVMQKNGQMDSTVK